jgi:hypothetical protein
MPLSSRFPKMLLAEQLADCANLTTIRQLGAGAEPVVTIVFTQRAGLFQRGESAGVPSHEAGWLIDAGLATAA